MRFAEDRRARVPFALVGVVLLVGSAGLSATLAGESAPREDDSVEVAVERATAATNTALRGAVARAGRRAASAPVTEPADTPTGEVLNDSSPFRDSLRVRIYLAARTALDGVAVRAGGVRASVSLPATPNATALRAAKRRVEIESVGRARNRGLRVRIENVSVSTTRAGTGETVEREEISPTLVVATPALALHERTERFESRLNRGPLAPGLGRRLTARMYAVAWARGYAQYGGAPVENVVSNRHVELATNGAILREQRVAFGRSDPAGRRAVAWATARVGLMDLLSAAHVGGGKSRRTRRLLAAARRYRRSNPIPGGVVDGHDSDRRHRAVRVAVNDTADRAFVDLLSDRGPDGFDALLRSTYAVDARAVASVEQTRDEVRPDPASPGSNWTLRESSVETEVRVENASGGPPGVPAGWHLLRGEVRRVVRTHALVAEWTRANRTDSTDRSDSANRNGSADSTDRSGSADGNRTTRTVRRWSDTFVVRIGVAGDHGATAAPSRPIVGVHERGGALGGPNLRGVTDRATERVIAGRGGFDALARRAVAGTLDSRPREVSGRRPAELREWAYRDLSRLRERVRNVSVEVQRGARIRDGPPPAAALARRLRDRRAGLLDAPARYDGVADRARVAVRAAYLDRVVERLEARAERTDATRSGLEAALADAGVSLDRARRTLRARTTPETPPPRPMPADGPGAATNLSVAGAPPYLTLAAVDSEQVPAIPEGERRHPLAARNRNLFTVPYGDAADAVVSAVGGGSRGRGTADLRTAALALRAANRTLAERDNRTLERRRDALQRSLAGSVQEVRRTLAEELAGGRVDLAAAQRSRAVRRGLARWNSTAGRALAVANGSAAEAVAAELRRERSAARELPRSWSTFRTERALEATRRAVDGPSRAAVERAGTTAERIARRAAKRTLAAGIQNATERARRRWFGEVLSKVPSGLPVAPVAGQWYATVNVWTVTVRGRYARFAVSAPQGTPAVAGGGRGGSGVVNGTVTYTRRAQVVKLDADGDGTAERLGRTTPVSFETETVVVVVVPPGAPGVGDTDGNADERSPGWKR